MVREQVDLAARAVAAAAAILELVPPGTVPTDFVMSIAQRDLRAGAIAPIVSCQMVGELLVLVWERPSPATFRDFLVRLRKEPVVAAQLEAARKAMAATKLFKKKEAKENEKRTADQLTLVQLTQLRASSMAAEKEKAAALANSRLMPGTELVVLCSAFSCADFLALFTS